MRGKRYYIILDKKFFHRHPTKSFVLGEGPKMGFFFFKQVFCVYWYGKI
jgi:hypothetical protein